MPHWFVEKGNKKSQKDSFMSLSLFYICIYCGPHTHTSRSAQFHTKKSNNPIEAEHLMTRNLESIALEYIRLSNM